MAQPPPPRRWNAVGIVFVAALVLIALAAATALLLAAIPVWQEILH